MEELISREVKKIDEKVALIIEVFQRKTFIEIEQIQKQKENLQQQIGKLDADITALSLL